MAPEPFRLPVQDLSSALRTEWLLTNGLGGYAMGTVLGANTRRYHGLLVAALTPPTGRVVALHSVIEQLLLGDDDLVELSSHPFGDDAALHPAGHEHLEAFDPMQSRGARWVYRVGGITLTRTLTLHADENSATLGWAIDGLERPAVLRLRPLVALRSFHDLDAEADAGLEVEADRAGALAVRRGERGLRLHAHGGTWTVEPQWWRGFAYPEERARGQAWREDVWSPGTCALALDPGSTTVELHCLVPDPPRSGAAPAAVGEGWFTPRQRLHLAARQFVVSRRAERGASMSVIAGYPWFADWGRDTMISLPGLLLTTGRLDEARSVLETFADHMRDGLLPNCFHDDEAPRYNTVDASLWFVHAVHAWTRASGGEPPDRLRRACREIVDAYVTGTNGIAVDPADGLVRAGDAASAMTWMDAARGGEVFTPRHGKAVEINALWHHALRCLLEMDERSSADKGLERLAAQCAESMRQKFWWPEHDCLHDVLVETSGAWRGDGRLRPNQVLAASLEFSPLSKAQRRGVVDAVERHLLTPYGLRTLSPDDPAYRGRYEGDLMERDAAYHQGTAWPWLIGPFAEAVLRLGDFDKPAAERVMELLKPLLSELDGGCLNQIAEVYDGDAPHRPSGCPAQAWSVAEVLRVLTLAEDILAS
jgi:glycogen debranching enzyme